MKHTIIPVFSMVVATLLTPCVVGLSQDASPPKEFPVVVVTQASDPFTYVSGKGLKSFGNSTKERYSEAVSALTQASERYAQMVGEIPAQVRRRTVEEVTKALRDLENATTEAQVKLTRELAMAEQAKAALAEAQAKIEAALRKAKARAHPSKDLPITSIMDDVTLFDLADGFSTKQVDWLIGVQGNTEKTYLPGFTIASVMDGSPAAKAGLEKGDVITACNGIRIKRSTSLTTIIKGAEDQELIMTVNRKGKEKPLKLKATPVRRQMLVDEPARGGTG